MPSNTIQFKYKCKTFNPIKPNAEDYVVATCEVIFMPLLSSHALSMHTNIYFGRSNKGFGRYMYDPISETSIIPQNPHI